MPTLPWGSVSIRCAALRNRNCWNADSAVARQQPPAVDFFGFTDEGYVAHRCPKWRAGSRIQRHVEVVAFEIHG